MANTKKTQKSVAAKPPAGDKKEASAGIPVVGIGASAGGLEALNDFFETMPGDNGMAFVVMQHLDPDHKSSLPQIISKHSRMPVLEVKDGTVPQINTVYVVPPGFTCSVINNQLRLSTMTDRLLRHPIDELFVSMADDLGPRAVGIVMSGTGTDGTIGTKAIKAAAGLTIAQDPASAKFEGMPASAAAFSDAVVPVDGMYKQLMDFYRHPYNTFEESDPELTSSYYSKILYLLQNHTGYDFSMYKMGTISRRIERRMTVNHLARLSDYVKLIKEQKHEAETLLQEILINVTSFFRDTESWESLKNDLTKYISGSTATKPLRIWVIGCSTGEEAYSITIILREILDYLQSVSTFQIFATDLNHRAVSIARLGVYPESITSQVSATRLKKFFIHHNDSYQVNPKLRDSIVFADHNVLTDPPFTHLDIICCRNLLIYLNPAVQKKLFALMHYSLNPRGLLFLGQSETVGNSELFTATDQKHKLYKKTDIPSPSHLVPPFNTHIFAKTPVSFPKETTSPTQPTGDVTDLAKHIVANEYTPAYILLDENANLLYVSGDTGKYLRLASGDTRWNALDMARDELRSRLTIIIHAALNSPEKPQVSEPITVMQGGTPWLVSLEARRISLKSKNILVIFHDLGKKKSKSRQKGASKATTESVSGVDNLKQELKFAQDSLEANVVELAKANEDLRVSNEELQSSNEELQSTNEELETSREELRSLNEELLSVNAEDRNRIEDLARSSDDLRNLLDNTDIAAIFLDRDLRIKSFSRAAIKLYPMITSDIGRPLKDISSMLVYEDFFLDAKEVLNKLVPLEKTICDKEGISYQIRIRPYRTVDKAIAGLVVTVLDVNESILTQKALEQAKNVLDTVRESMVVLDGDLRVVSANKSFYQLFKLSPKDTVGQRIYHLGNREWDVPKLRKRLKNISKDGGSFEDYTISLNFPGIGKIKMRINARLLLKTTGSPHILMAIEDVTDEAADKK
ncbi:MAG: CheR family methyltransferase [Dehalogenimonas sp.]